MPKVSNRIGNANVHRLSSANIGNAARSVPVPVARTEVFEGNALSGITQLAQVGNKLAQDALQRQRERQEKEALQNFAQFEIDVMQRQQETNLQEIPEDKTLFELHKRDFDEAETRFLAEVPGFIREDMRLRTSRVRSSAASRSIGEQARRDGILAKQGYENTVTNLVNNSILNPGNLENNKQLLRDVTEKMNSVDPVTKQLLLEDGLQKIGGARAALLARDNPDQFEKNAKAGQYNDLKNLPTLMATAKAARKSMEVEQKRKNTEANAAVTAIADRLTQGFDIPVEELSYTQQIVKEFGNAKTQARLDNLLLTKPITDELKQMDPVSLQTVINTEFLPATRNDGATENEVILLEQAQSILDNMKSEIKNDPMSYAATTGTLVNQIDIDSPQSILERVNTAVSVADKFGSEIKPLTDEEAGLFTAQIEEASPDETFEFIKNISEIGRQGGYVFRQLQDDNDQFAHAGGLYTFSPGHAPEIRKMLRGQKSLKENPTFSPPPADIIADYRSLIGNALGEIPKQDNALMSAAVSHYIGSGKFQGQYNRRDFQNSVRIMLGGFEGEGGVAEFNGRKMVLPSGVTRARFDDFLEEADDETYKKFSIGGEPPTDLQGRTISHKVIEKMGEFETVDHGTYRVRINGQLLLGGGPDGLYTFNIDKSQIDAIIGR